MFLSFHLAFKNFNLKSAELFILHYMRHPLGFCGAGVRSGVRSPLLGGVPAPARSGSSPEIYRQSPFADSFLSGLITSTPNCPGPSSFPPVIYFLPQGRRSSAGPPFWLWGSFRTLKGNRGENRGGGKEGNEVKSPLVMKFRNPVP